MTLVELVAGLTLLASVLVGVLLAFAAHQRQARSALKRTAACNAADQLLSNWYADQERVPRNARGSIGGAVPMVWTTRTIQRTRVESLPVDISGTLVSGAGVAVTTVPEPGSWGLLLLAAGMLAGGRRTSQATWKYTA